MIPTITSCTPSAGHTGGQTLIEVSGTGFALPPAPTARGPTVLPKPSVSVTLGGVACPTVWVISSTLLRALTPIHDPSGLPATDTAPAVSASDLVVQNLDATGAQVPGEVVTLPACYSFQRPVRNATVITVTLLAIEQLVTELARQVHPNVEFQPHTDYDPNTGDGLDLVTFASLPGIGLIGLRLPTSQDIGDREQPEIELGGGLVAVRRQPLIRDAYLTCVGASDSSGELLWLETNIAMFAQKNGALLAEYNGSPLFDITGNRVSWQLDYRRGEPVTVNDRTAGVVWFTATFVIRRIVETDMAGITGASTPGDALGVHEATTGIAYKANTINVEKQSGLT